MAEYEGSGVHKEIRVLRARAEDAEKRLVALQEWLLRAVGTASSVRSAQRTVERLVASALDDTQSGGER